MAVRKSTLKILKTITDQVAPEASKPLRELLNKEIRNEAERKVEDAKARLENEEITKDSRKEAAAHLKEAKIIKHEVNAAKKSEEAQAKTGAHKHDSEATTVKRREGQKRKRVDTGENLQRDRDVYETVLDKKRKLGDDANKKQELGHELRRNIAEDRKESLEKQEEILDATKQIQEETKPTLEKVKLTQTEVLAAEKEITADIKQMTEEYLENIKTIHANEEASHSNIHQTAIETARSTFAMDVVREQAKLAMELLEYQAEIKKVQAAKKEKIDEKMTKELSDKETNLYKKVKACEVKQNYFVQKVNAQVGSQEMAKLAGYMTNELKAKSFERVQEYRAHSSDRVSGAIGRGVTNAKTAINNEQKVINALSPHIQAEGDLANNQRLLNAKMQLNPELAEQFKEKTTPRLR